MPIFITGRPARRYCVYSVAPINVKFGTGERTRANFHVYRGRNVGIRYVQFARIILYWTGIRGLMGWLRFKSEG